MYIYHLNKKADHPKFLSKRKGSLDSYAPVQGKAAGRHEPTSTAGSTWSLNKAKSLKFGQVNDDENSDTVMLNLAVDILEMLMQSN